MNTHNTEIHSLDFLRRTEANSCVIYFKRLSYSFGWNLQEQFFSVLFRRKAFRNNEKHSGNLFEMFAVERQQIMGTMRYEREGAGKERLS